MRSLDNAVLCPLLYSIVTVTDKIILCAHGVGHAPSQKQVFLRSSNFKNQLKLHLHISQK